MKNFLPDINFWLALCTKSHVHHALALNWFNGQSEGAALFCRVTQMGFLRLLTQPKVMGSEVLTLHAAWKAYDTALQDARISFMEEPPRLEPHWRTLTSATRSKHTGWTDAYLAAFAFAADARVVTFDQTFPAFPGHPVQFLTH